MPRVKLGIPSPAQQRAVFNKTGKKAMVEQDIDDCTALALRLGMDNQAVRRRMQIGNWKLEELWRLVRVLQLDGDQVAVMLGAVKRPTT